MKIEKEIQTIDTEVLANYILQEYGTMSHLKLQKLLYYTEAYHMAHFETSLILDEFEAWVHGPVCRRIYDKLKGKSKLFSDISFTIKENEESPKEILNRVLTSSQVDFINGVLGSLSEWSDQELEDATHVETPWIEARRGYDSAAICENLIDKNLMLEFYRKELLA